MSAATEFAPVVDIPPHARLREQRTATIIALQRPSAESVAAPLRLTRRGVLVLALAVALLSAGLVLSAWLSAPSASAGRPPQPATVVVHDGDTLWSIATRIAPDRDPRAEVADLQRRNHLVGVELTAGQVLRAR
jgi:nucleoid-associated protein YgaU